MSDQIQFEPRACRLAEPSRITVLRRAEVLRNVDIFSKATVEELLRIAAISGEIRFKAGEVLFRQGEIADALYIITEGRVEIKNEGRGETLGACEAIGLYEVLSDETRYASALAVEDTYALKIEAEDFFDLVSHNTEIVQSLFRLLIQKLASNGKRP